MPYWRLFYHVIWSTRNREHFLAPVIEREVHRVVANKATDLGAIVHAVGGMEDHVHLVVSVSPHIALSKVIGQSKGSSSHFANYELGLQGSFAWQAEYGVVSFSSNQLARVVAYVRDQRQHHEAGTTINSLEQTSAD